VLHAERTASSSPVVVMVGQKRLVRGTLRSSNLKALFHA
jgi:hypothetical protein